MNHRNPTLGAGTSLLAILLPDEPLEGQMLWKCTTCLARSQISYQVEPTTYCSDCISELMIETTLPLKGRFSNGVTVE